MGFGGGGAVHDSVAAAKIGRDDFPTRPRRANDAGTAPLVTVQTCGDLRTIRRVVEGQPSTESPPQTVPVPSNVNSYPLAHLLRTPVRCVINADTGLPQELAKQMREVTRQIAGLTNELERLLPRDRYIRDRPTNAPPAGCSDDSAR